MDRLLLTTCLTPAALILSAAPVLAQTTVSSASTTALNTAAAGDVTVASGGSITVGSGSAIAVNSNNAATVASGGTLAVGGADGAAGIAQTAGTTSALSNAGTINVLETFSAPVDSVSVVTGPIASASNRYGMYVLPGVTSGGSITNSGTITVDGLNSAGIKVASDYAGSITNSGAITVKGDNSVGIATQGVTGNVTVAGTVSAIGQGAQGVVLGGDVGGTFTLQGTVSQPTSYTADDGTTQSLSRSNLSNGKAAVEVDGSVAGGILIATTSSNANTAATTTSGAITSVGNAPALLIGGTSNSTIGTVTGVAGTYSLVVDGSAAATASYSSTNAYGIVIGGQGGNVSMPGGIGVSGSVSATTFDSTATGILINAGSTVPVLYNDGTISATISQTGQGGTYAIRDLSGTLATINNSNTIKVTGSSADALNAIDVSKNTTGVTISQYLDTADAATQATAAAATGYDPLKATVYASITGNILTGSGNDLLDIQTGTVTGNAYLGGGNDTVKLSGTSIYTGNITFGAGTPTMAMSGYSRFIGTMDADGQVGTLTLADNAKFYGAVANGSQLAVNVNGGTFGASSVGTTSLGSLNVGSGGTLGVYIASPTSYSTYQVGTATFASGSKISATFASLSGVEGHYTVVTAGTLTGGENLTTASASLPVLFKGGVTVDGNNIDLDITRKTASELGLTRTQGQAYDAIFAAGTRTAALGNSLLQAADVATLQGQFNQLLPDHSGGVFDTVQRGSRLAYRHITDADSMFDISDVGGWLEPFYFHGSKDADGASAYKTDGWGISFGLEKHVTWGYVGVSLAYIGGTVKDGDWQKVKTNDWEAGLFWRRAAGPLYTYARVAAGTVSMGSTRTFTGTVDDATLSYSAGASWKGLSLSGAAGASYKFVFGNNFTLKPMVAVDYYRLHERGYTETGSDAILLTVDSRTSQSLTATPTLTVGWSTGEVTADYRPLTFELEGGPRAHIAGDLGTTTAAFVDGDRFSLTPDALKSGWMAEARILGGSFDHSWKLAAGADKIAGGVDYSARASLNVAF